MSWRPDGWEDIVDGILKNPYIYIQGGIGSKRCIEDTADAILKALRKNGMRLNKGQKVFNFPMELKLGN